MKASLDGTPTTTSRYSADLSFPDAAHRPSTRDLPSLDGLRAVSIAFVILGHASQGHGTPLIRMLLSRLSQFGVSVFFAISGYLITSLLWREAKKSGTVNLPRFYLRRTTRIFPPYYAYLAIVGIGVGLHAWQAPVDTRWWPAVAYLTNFFGTHYWMLNHGWSLSLEEQFYLTWPVLLALCIRTRGAAAGARTGYRLALAAVCAFPLLRVVLYLVTRNGALTGAIIFDFVAAGSAIALFDAVGESGRVRRLLDATISSTLTPLTAVLALMLHLAFAAGMRWRFVFGILISTPLEAILLAIFVLWAVRNPDRLFGRLLNLRVLRIVGIGSYSLYLWQEMFFGFESPFSSRYPLLVRLAAVCACAAASYWLIERPALRMRALLERRLFQVSA